MHMCTQGRPSSSFVDHNEHVLTELLTMYPTCVTMEMETFHLFDLARCSMGRVCMVLVLVDHVGNVFDSWCMLVVVVAHDMLVCIPSNGGLVCRQMVLVCAFHNMYAHLRAHLRAHLGTYVHS